MSPGEQVVKESLDAPFHRLSASNAVAALVVTEDGRYLLQLRDQKPNIWYPGHWGLFGGAVDAGETPEEALCRELTEEIDYTPTTFTRFTSFTFDFGFMGQGAYYRTFYEVAIPSVRLPELVLGEGREIRAFAAEEVLALTQVVPYDAFALYLHIHRVRFV